MKIIHVGTNFEYKTINEAILSINSPTYIYLEDERYYEKVVIDKENIIIDGKGKAVVTYDDYATKIHEDGREYVTFRTYTMLIKAPHVTLLNLTIKNEAGEGYLVGQAVALHLYNDDINVINCTLNAKQDTLFCGPFSQDLIERYIDLLPSDERVYDKEFHQRFINCTISGTVDFIFGGASVDFINCKIYSLPTKSDSWIAAPDHEKENLYGMNFINCDILSKTKERTVYLARPWREYGYVSYINCYLDSHIKDEGFSIWEGTNRHENCRFYEYNSYGPGKNDDKRIYFAHVIKEK